MPAAGDTWSVRKKVDKKVCLCALFVSMEHLTSDALCVPSSAIISANL